MNTVARIGRRHGDRAGRIADEAQCAGRAAAIAAEHTARAGRRNACAARGDCEGAGRGRVTTALRVGYSHRAAAGVSNRDWALAAHARGWRAPIDRVADTVRGPAV